MFSILLDVLVGNMVLLFDDVFDVGVGGVVGWYCVVCLGDWLLGGGEDRY